MCTSTARFARLPMAISIWTRYTGRRRSTQQLVASQSLTKLSSLRIARERGMHSEKRLQHHHEVSSECRSQVHMKLVPVCSACPGDTSVCIGKMGLLGEDWQNRKAVDDKSSVKGKRNFYTNPPRKGGMGTSLMDRTIGRNAPEYKPDAYQYALVLGKELRQKARERIPKPFNSSPNRGSGLFSTTFLGSVPESPCPQGEKSMPSKPFIPSHPARSGNAYCALSKIGRNYVPVTVDTNQVCCPPPCHAHGCACACSSATAANIYLYVQKVRITLCTFG
jgi:hypothetical protein